MDRESEVELSDPSTVKGTDGEGRWTMVYDEGVDFTVGDNSYMAFFRYTPKFESQSNPEKIEDFLWHCGETVSGWYHPSAKAPQTGWGCFIARQVEGDSQDGKKYNTGSVPSLTSEGGDEDGGDALTSEDPVLSPTASFREEQGAPSARTWEDAPSTALGDALDSGVLLQASGTGASSAGPRGWKLPADHEYVAEVNARPDTAWRARVHDHLTGMSRQEAQRRLGVSATGKSVRFRLKAAASSSNKHRRHRAGSAASASPSRIDQANPLPADPPAALDWRQVEDGKYMTPVVDQGNCGSCFAISAADVVSMRRKIHAAPGGWARVVQEHTKRGASAAPGSSSFVQASAERRGASASLRRAAGHHARRAQNRAAAGERAWAYMSGEERAVVSAQAVVSCSAYNQGCDGGYPYLVGKFGRDVGFVPAVCMKYTGQDSGCDVAQTCRDKLPTSPAAFLQSWAAAASSSALHTASALSAYVETPRLYSGDFEYVGGYYGACDEEAMKRALVRGPVAVVMYAPGDLFYYSEGVYNMPHTPKSFVDKQGDSRWEKSNHAVVAVGYGATQDGRPYWIIKNSWGEQWGDGGYFKVARGNDLLAAESSAVEIMPE